MKRFLSLVLTVCVLVSVFSVLLTVPASAVSHVQDGKNSGLEISSHSSKSKSYGADYYETVKHLEEVPRTFEAWVYLSSLNVSSEVGTIIGNYGKAGGSFSFGLTKQFNPELLFYNGSAGKANPTHKAVFKDAVLSTSIWNHIVVTVDEAQGELKCYVNGELKQTIKAADTCATSSCDGGCIGIFRLEWAAKYPVHLGGTDEPLNPMYFRGWLQDTAMYSDVLTADEVKANYKNGINAYDENLICYYDIDASDKGKCIEDASGNGYDLYYSRVFLTEEEMQALREEKGFAKEYAYSLAVIGDIQYLTRISPSSLTKMYQWIAANKDEKNIQYAIGLGDITDQCQEAEWYVARDVYKILEEAGLEYSLVRGNHDVATVGGISESSRPTARPEMYDELFYNNDFYRSQFENYGGFYKEGSVINTYRTIKFGGDDFLIVNIDFQADSDIRAWANEVIASHPDHRTIIVTHEYIGASGTPSSYGKKLWADVASKHKNVELVLGGHVTYDNINVYQCKGENGNTVTQMLIDAQNFDLNIQGGLGVVTMFYFREDGTVFDVEHYSTVKNRYLMNINQLTVDLRAECDYSTVSFDGNTAIEPSGEGTAENPYKISSAGNLLWMAQQQLVKEGETVIVPTTLVNPFENKYFVQTCDINLNGKTLPSIGYSFASEGVGSVFGGNYNGAGYVIRNGKISNPLSSAASVGLFGETLGACVSNLSLKNIIIDANQNTAFLVGRANGNDSLKNCRVYDSCYFTFNTAFENKINIGALVGLASDISIVSCEGDADILALGTQANAGSLVGLINGESVLYNSVSNSEIAVAGDSFGALFGEGYGSITAVGCKNKTDLKDYNLADGAQIHTATKFTKKDGTGHTAKCECGKDIELQCVKSEHGYCKYCELDISGASVSLKSDVAINYFVSIKDRSIIQGKTLAMEFTMNGETVTVTEHYVKDGKIVFTLGGILFRQIGDLIDAKLVILEENSSKVIASKLGYSVRENCLELLKENDDEKLSALINALLEYATKEQVYLDYKTDSFVAGGVSIPAFDSVPDKEDGKVLTGKNADYKITGAYAKVDSSLALRIEMNILDLSAVTVTLNGTELDKTKLIPLGEGKYALEVKNFAPYLLNGEIEICILKDGNAEAKVLFGADSHLYSLIQDKKQIEEDKANYKPVTKKVDENELVLFLSIYRYGLAAEEYYNHLAEVSK